MFDFIGNLFGYVLNFFQSFTHNYGISLLLFTIFTRILMFPLTISQQKSSMKMARLTPKQKELQKRYANNKEKYEEELQKLYSKEGYNPTSGCLPMLIQFPILLGLYAAVRQPLTLVLKLPKEIVTSVASVMNIDTTKDGYYQISMLKNLIEGGKDQYIAPLNNIREGLFDELSAFANEFDLGINLLPVPSAEIGIGNWFPIIIVPIFVFVAQIGSMWLSQKITKVQQQAAGGCNPMVMNVMLSLMTFGFAFSVPAALGFYWICTSLISPLQSYIVHKFYNAGVLEAKSEAQRVQTLIRNEKKIIDEVGEAEFLPNYDAVVVEEPKQKGKKGPKKRK